MTERKKSIFVFIDEAGDFNFTKSGSDHFVMAAYVTTDPQSASFAIDELKYEYIANGISDQVPFHANENSRGTKQRIINVINSLKTPYWLHLVYADKHYAHPSKHNPEAFYTLMGGAVASYFLTALSAEYSNVSFVFDIAIHGKQRDAFSKAIQSKLEAANREFSIHFQAIKEDGNGVIADYYAWSYLRKLESSKSVWFNKLPQKGEPFNIFRNGHTKYW